MKRFSPIVRTAFIILALCALAFSQPETVKRTLVVNGHSGEAILLNVNGRYYVDLETLAHISNGDVSFQDSQITITLPATSSPSVDQSSSATTGMSRNFMSSGVEFLARIKEWVNTLSYAAQRGVPGDGSRIVVLHDRAAETLRLSRAAASTDSDHNSVQLLSNLFDIVGAWSDKLIGERKKMDTGKYSMSMDAFTNDETYKKISSCSKFLGEMIPSGHFLDDAACH